MDYQGLALLAAVLLALELALGWSLVGRELHGRRLRLQLRLWKTLTFKLELSLLLSQPGCREAMHIRRRLVSAGIAREPL